MIRTVFSLLVLTHFLQAGPADTARAVTSGTVPVRMPFVGYAVSASGTELRAIFGLSGTYLATRVDLPVEVSGISIAPGGQYALAARAADGAVVAMPLSEAGVGAAIPVDGAPSQPDSIAFSPSGARAVFYSSAAGQLRQIAGLPDSARASVGWNTQTWPSLTALAVSDDGLVMAGFASGDGGFVSVINEDGSLQNVFNASWIQALRFYPGARDILIADSLANQIYLLAGPGFTPTLLATQTQGVNLPLDVELSPDTRNAYIANAGGANLLSVDLASGNVSTVNCGFAAAAFERLPGSAMAIVGRDDDTKSWLLNLQGLAPWVTFVPRTN